MIQVLESEPPELLKAVSCRVDVTSIPSPCARNIERNAVPDAARIRAAVLRVMGR